MSSLSTSASSNDGSPRARLSEVAALFFRLGVTAFGGPAVHIAMIEEEVVRRRGWLTHEELLDLMGATNLIPGPNSTEVAIHVGRKVAGWRGLLVAGFCFIVPAASITLALAWAYVRFGSFPRFRGVLRALEPIVLAVVLQAIVELAKKALKTRALVAIAVAAIVASALGVHELLVLLGAGVLAMGVLRPRAAAALVLGTGLSSSVAAAAPSAPQVFVSFAKIGSVLFGSGYVLVAFLRSELVARLHWLTEPQLLDAVAAGQITPGPVFTTSTFVGYVVAGGPGALAATIGIFAPAFVFVAISAPLLPKLRGSPLTGRLLDGVNVASLALMAVVTARLARTALVDPITVALFVASAVALVRFKLSSVWLVAVGTIVGLFLRGT